MKKRIIVTLLVLITTCALAYVWVRYRSNITCRKEIAIAREFLAETVRADEPSLTWVQQCDLPSPTNAFFFFKIWFEDVGVSASRISRAYVDLPAWEGSTSIMFNLNYGRYLPVIQCVVTPSNGANRVRATFPLNNCYFYPDVNGDKRIDKQDLIAWRTERNKSKQPRERDK